MKYSYAFEQLHEMSLILNLRTSVKYKRVAIFIGRVMMVDSGMRSYVVGIKTRPITVFFPWSKDLIGFKEKILPYVVQLTDSEWKKIHYTMIKNLNHLGGISHWKTKRREFVYSLGTMREFDRE